MRNTFLRLLIGAAFAMPATPLLASSLPGAPDDVVRFDINRFDVQGNTLLPAKRVDAAVQAFAGRNRSFSDVQRALEALEEEYRKAGYSVVQVALPEQELNHGVVRLQVVETKIGKVRVEGNQHFDTMNIRASVPALREGITPDVARASSSLRLANENPAKKVNLQLQSAQQDGEIDAILKVSDERPWKLMGSLDNSGNSSTGNTHLTLQAQHANVANLDQVLSVQYTTTVEKPSKVSVYGAGYHIPFYALGDSLDLFASYSNVDSGSVTAGIFALQVSGRGSVLGARYNQNLKRIGDYEHRLSYGLDYKAFQNNVSLSGVQLGNDVTVHPVSLAYNGTLGLNGTELNVGATLVRNLPGGSRGTAADFERVRAGAPAAYTLLRYNAALASVFAKDWQWRLNLTGQTTGDALVPGEQFGAGGMASVRGFEERELSSDSGWLVNAEVYTPNLCGGMAGMAAQCRALAFYDTASVSRNKPLPGEAAQGSIGSAGVGMRLALGNRAAMQLDLGQVINAGPLQAKGERKLHFRLSLNY
ncbi:ShlB/FhaC/HecB family hemolysin secretion/activation protein [Noviherbaspirillum galbum]|uniref:ShlB/FhaC/HecB family hemolysin secretion/activation protein n=1 Tax=Noviherbaspirillum galbum TaxID=2709383 RepID=A0A6B3SI36_9BURK|nr:ShlB/FhaC/HecB family hemolysin secretion/activation protein [Noviherbaspirillum galbum]NEX60471.1 ShlB/FhaC/HecB family hemolysin secretion/activation protein [Noviherbaspirillum galbum]